MLISDSCHCRNIEFTFNWKPDPLEIPARACTWEFGTVGGAYLLAALGALFYLKK
ncbi:hypothetical protein [Photorhabdus heterorhabditis]|uniref:hypothetical protein n=1 Tax=Photorhabdus heterorhabditis TaxID=880156 RepID=UPI000A93C444|nr:hypothetical protein [Photorhabdus heterorhabditis]